MPPPVGVANQEVGSGKDMKSKVAVDGVVWVAAGGAIAQFSAVVPSDVDEVSEQDGYVVTVSGATETSGRTSYSKHDCSKSGGEKFCKILRTLNVSYY